MLRLLFFLALLGAVVYAVFWVIDRRSQGHGDGGTPRPLPPRPMGPDDDEDFLRELERRKRHNQD